MNIGALHKFLLIFALILLVIPSLNLHAASTNPYDVTSLILKASPDYPKAGQLVTVTATSYSIDLNRSLVRWYVDDTLAKEGAAMTTFTITAGAYGSTKKVKVQAIAADGTVIEQRVNISPSEVSLVWEANTYTPPFYKGKKLYSFGSDATVIAIPSTKYSNNELIYTWKNDGQVILESSGLGKNRITLPGSFITREKNIWVDVISLDGLYKAHAEIVLAGNSPRIFVYEDSPLYGVIFETAIGADKKVDKGELKLNAYPFFFSTKNRLLGDVKYSWGISDETEEVADKSAVILKSDVSRKVLFTIGTQHINNILQAAQTNLSLNFNQ